MPYYEYGIVWWYMYCDCLGTAQLLLVHNTGSHIVIECWMKQSLIVVKYMNLLSQVSSTAENYGGQVVLRYEYLGHWVRVQVSDSDIDK